MTTAERLAWLTLQRQNMARQEEISRATYRFFRSARIELDREIAELGGGPDSPPVAAHACCDVPTDDPAFESQLASTAL